MPELPRERVGRTPAEVDPTRDPEIALEHEGGPGIDNRDEVLHGFERAQSDSELQQAAEAFLAWAKELDLLAPPSDT